jgi:hypothetical protein
MGSETNRLDDAQFARWWAETGENEVRQILHWKWDPLCISDQFPYAADEYDSYAAQIAAVLRNGAAAGEIAELLGAIERERMGLGQGSPDRRRALGDEILTWFECSQNRWVEFGPLRR